MTNSTGSCVDLSTDLANQLHVLRGYSWLFPVGQGHQFIYDFQQSLKPPFLLGDRSCVFPVEVRTVCFADFGYFFPQFLDTTILLFLVLPFDIPISFFELC